MIGAGHGQVALRNIRRNAIEAVKKLEKGTTPISEDESKSMQVLVTVPWPSPPHSCHLALAPSRHATLQSVVSRQRQLRVLHLCIASRTEATASVYCCGGGGPVVQDEVQKKTDKCVKELDDLAKAKEKELNTV